MIRRILPLIAVLALPGGFAAAQEKLPEGAKVAKLDARPAAIKLTGPFTYAQILVTATLDVYLSQVNNNLSAIMKRLTGVTVLLAGVGAIAGIFGMSEAGLAFSGGEAAGFWLVAVVTISIAVIAALALRRKGWI